MPAKLHIQDSPYPKWWYSPAISVNPWPPVIGKTSYISAQVDNNGDAQAGKARIEFFWGDPSTQLRLDTVTPIGGTTDDIPIGGKSVKSPAWISKPGEGGHKCLIVVAHDVTPPFDTTYGGNPAFPFDPPKHPEVAQLNLTILEPGVRSVLVHVPGNPRTPKRCTVRAERGDTLDAERLSRLGLHGYRESHRPQLQVTLTKAGSLAWLAAPQPGAGRELELEMAAGANSGVEVAIDAAGLGPREYALVDVVEREDGTIVGGCSFLVVGRLPADDREERAAVTVAVPERE